MATALTSIGFILVFYAVKRYAKVRFATFYLWNENQIAAMADSEAGTTGMAATIFMVCKPGGQKTKRFRNMWKIVGNVGCQMNKSVPLLESPPQTTVFRGLGPWPRRGLTPDPLIRPPGSATGSYLIFNSLRSDAFVCRGVVIGLYLWWRPPVVYTDRTRER